MSQFRYSKDEYDINRILKLNQDISNEISNNHELLEQRNDADSNIESTKSLLIKLGKKKDIDRISIEIDNKKGKRKLNHRPIIQDWETILSDTAGEYSKKIVLEDIVSNTEINESIYEYNAIEAQFSAKTSIINKRDLSFLVIAIALQVLKTLLFPYASKKFGYGDSFNPDDRLAHNDKSIEAEHRNANDRFRNHFQERYKPGYWINMLYQTPPYDITAGSKDLGINMGEKHIECIL